MIGLAETRNELLPAYLPHRFKTDIGNIGNFPCDFRGVGHACQIANGNAEHLLLLELAQPRIGGSVILRRQWWLQPTGNFARQALLSTRVLDVFDVQRRQPGGIGDQQIAQRQ